MGRTWSQEMSCSTSDPKRMLFLRSMVQKSK
eukprot:IDg22346t1